MGYGGIGMVPTEVPTDRAAAYPPALPDVLPTAWHQTSKAVQQRIGWDHQHRQGRRCPTRGFKTPSGSRVLCAGHAFLRNLRGGCYDLARQSALAQNHPAPSVARLRDALTVVLSVR